MRKIKFLIISLFLILSFSSCFTNHHQTNYFVEGDFFGVNEYNQDEKFYFSVKSIIKDEYDSSSGRNVVFDKYKKVYYSLQLFYEINSERYQIDFLNLTPYGTPISYEDDNKNHITPFISDNNNSPRFGAAIYKLEIQRSCFEVEPTNSKENIAFIYMRYKEDSK